MLVETVVSVKVQLVFAFRAANEPITADQSGSRVPEEDSFIPRQEVGGRACRKHSRLQLRAPG